MSVPFQQYFESLVATWRWDPDAALVASIATLALIAAIIVVRSARFRPAGQPSTPETAPQAVALHLPMKQALCIPNSNDVRGKVGEAVASSLLARSGWLQVASKLSRDNGVDGLFVRPLKPVEWQNVEKTQRSVRVEALIVEVKANTSRFKKEQVTKSGVCTRLQLLSEGLPEQMAGFLDMVKQVVEEDNPLVKRQFWRVNLHTGNITVTDIEGDGEKIISRHIANARRLVQALTLAFAGNECASDLDDSTAEQDELLDEVVDAPLETAGSYLHSGHMKAA